jgi:hypothetical protein
LEADTLDRRETTELLGQPVGLEDQIVQVRRAGPVNIMASGVISSYYNPFAIDGGVKIPIKIHPRVPPRTPTHGDASKHIASRARVERIAEPSEIDRFAVGARKVTS